MNNQSLKIRIKPLREGARLPHRSTPSAAGADLHCVEAFTLQPGERKLIHTGIAVEIPPGWYGRVAPRSGLAFKHGIDTLAGVIDPDYRGELNVLLINLGQAAVGFNPGDRIAQLIVERAASCEYLFFEDLSDSVRGEGGFGSTGN